MEWKRIKTVLILLFVILNSFLIFQLYKKNVNENFNSKTFESLKTIIETKNIKLVQDIKDLPKTSRMKRMLIESEKGFTEDFIILIDGSHKPEGILTGKKKDIISFVTLLTNFIRDEIPENITIENICLGYFYDSSQISEGVLSGEAEPVWIIDVSEKGRYIYNAYTGLQIKRVP